MQKLLIGCLALLLSLQACRKNTDVITETPQGPIPVENVQSSLIGRVLDENNNPVENAKVYLENGDERTTNAAGLFFYTNKLMNKNGTYIRVEKAGYYNAARFSYQHLGGTANMEIKLLPLGTNAQFNSTTGGNVDVGNDVNVTFPANSIMKADGSAYNGTVTAYAVWLDPTLASTFSQMPGDLRAEDKDGNARLLTTYGMVGVELVNSIGEKLQLATGKKATISMQVPAALLSAAPSTIPLWHFDEVNGYWKEEGEATLNNGRYEGEVSHFSFWNCDVPMDYILLNGCVGDNAGNLVANVRVRLTRTNGQSGYDLTDNLGNYGGLVPANETMTLEIIDPCENILYTAQVGPFTADTDLPKITIPAADLVTVSGSLVDCNNDAIAFGVVEAALGGQFFVTTTDASGNFSFSSNNCANESTVTVTGYDNASPNQSIPLSVNIVGGIATTGEIVVCTALDEYIQVNIDGQNEIYSSNLQYTTWQSGGYVLGYGTSGPVGDSTFVSINFTDIVGGQATVQALQGAYLSVSTSQYTFFGCEYCATCDCEPTDAAPVTFTSVPNAPGEYAIGSTSGNVKQNGVLVPFTISFRVKQ